MPDASPKPDQSLHLPSLVIKNFRGIDELTIPRLGRVTLLAGKNGVGKTTVLDAVRVWASQGRSYALVDVLYDRDEVYTATNEGGVETILVDWDALFYGRSIDRDDPIKIGPTNSADFVRIRFVLLGEADLPELAQFRMMLSDAGKEPTLEITFGNWRRSLVVRYLPVYPEFLPPSGDGLHPPAIVCGAIGPDVPSYTTFERLLDDLVLTPGEEQALEAFKLVMDAPVERVAMVGTGTSRLTGSKRRLIAKVEDQVEPVPFRSLGDGAVRAFAVALALAKSSGGFLLIDEAENGIHHSIQAKFWNMVLQTAQRNNVQVLATTHSWDCVKGFAHAANELEDVEGLLVRIQRVPIGLRAITYDESRLENIAKHGIEVR